MANDPPGTAVAVAALDLLRMSFAGMSRAEKSWSVRPTFLTVSTTGRPACTASMGGSNWSESPKLTVKC
jgi:hypothetical protein